MSTLGYFHFRWKWGSLSLAIVGVGGLGQPRGLTDEGLGVEERRRREDSNVALLLSSRVDVALVVEASH